MGQREDDFLSVLPDPPAEGKARHFKYATRFEDQGDGSGSALFDAVSRKQVEAQRHILKAPKFEVPKKGRLELPDGTVMSARPPRSEFVDRIETGR